MKENYTTSSSTALIDALFDRMYFEGTIAIGPDSRIFYPHSSETFAFYRVNDKTSPLLISYDELASTDPKILLEKTNHFLSTHSPFEVATNILTSIISSITTEKNFFNIVYLFFDEKDQQKNDELKEICHEAWNKRTSLESNYLKTIIDLLANKIIDRREKLTTDFFYTTIMKIKNKQKESYADIKHQLRSELINRLEYLNGFINFFLSKNGVILIHDSRKSVMNNVKTIFQQNTHLSLSAQHAPSGLAISEAKFISIGLHVFEKNQAFSNLQKITSSPSILGYQLGLQTDFSKSINTASVGEILVEELYDFFSSSTDKTQYDAFTNLNHTLKKQCDYFFLKIKDITEEIARGQVYTSPKI